MCQRAKQVGLAAPGITVNFVKVKESAEAE